MSNFSYKALNYDLSNMLQFLGHLIKVLASLSDS